MAPLAGRCPTPYRLVIDPNPFLERAVELARLTMRENRGGPFGAVVVKDGAIVGEGANLVLAANDPTAHAEVTAIRDACSRLGTFKLTGATIYASSEPCPMCLAAIYWARIERIVYANDRAAAARIGFDDAFFYDELARAPRERRIPMVCTPLDAAERLFREWAEKPDKTPY